MKDLVTRLRERIDAVSDERDGLKDQLQAAQDSNAQIQRKLHSTRSLLSQTRKNRDLWKKREADARWQLEQHVKDNRRRTVAA